VLCSGKVYHELEKRRAEVAAENTALVRIEQLYPFNADMLAKVLAAYPAAKKEIVWAQEEPRNAGAYLYVADVLRQTPELKIELGYIGRPATASPAVGSKHTHYDQQAALMATVFPGEPTKDAAGPAGAANGAAKHEVKPAAAAKPGAGKGKTAGKS